jgi:hypothetical protein
MPFKPPIDLKKITVGGHNLISPAALAKMRRDGNAETAARYDRAHAARGNANLQLCATHAARWACKAFGRPYDSAHRDEAIQTVVLGGATIIDREAYDQASRAARELLTAGWFPNLRPTPPDEVA